MANGSRLNVVSRLYEHNNCLADGELVLRLKRVITSGLELLQEVLNVAGLVLELEVGDDADIGRLQMGRGVRGRKRTCVRIE